MEEIKEERKRRQEGGENECRGYVKKTRRMEKKSLVIPASFQQKHLAS